ncbi:MAG: NusG domain II-containing protein [Coriobacteriia bacterium]|nr:NusG domain II-containing protein [Coriobacteriia bacterium]
MTRGDRIVVAIVAVLAAAAWPLSALASSAQGADTVIVTAPHGSSRLPLDREGRVSIEGLHGPVTLVIENGSVRVADSSCPDGLCVHQGAVATPGGAIVCAPNAVSVRIGGGGDAPDAVVR